MQTVLKICCIWKINVKLVVYLCKNKTTKQITTECDIIMTDRTDPKENDSSKF